MPARADSSSHPSRSGYFSDYFMTAVRTGPKSLTMMLIERDDTVETRKIRTSYSSAAGTAYVFFEGTKVPVENVLGGEGNGLKGASSSFPRAVVARG